MKVISKIITDRLSEILPQIISPEQRGFTKGRGLSDNILLAQEMIHKLDSNCRGGNVIFKLDLAKAYDRISWLFILKSSS